MPDEGSVESYFLDRFGLVLLAISFTVGVLLLADLPRQSTATSIGEVVVTLLTAVTLVLALLASGVTRPVIRIAVIAVVGFVVWSLISFFIAIEGVAFFRVLWFLLVVTTPWVVLRRLVAHSRVTIETLLGAASVYLLLAVMFMFLFLAIDALEPGQFFGDSEPTTSFMYFSLVTITTLGYGDLAPQTEVARVLAVATAVVGQVYLVFIVARMVGLYTASAAFERRGPVEPPPRVDREQG